MPSNEVVLHRDRGRSQSRRAEDNASQAAGDNRSSTHNSTRSSRHNDSTRSIRRGSLRSYISTAVASLRALRSTEPSDDRNSTDTDGTESIGRGNRSSSRDTSLTSLLVPSSGRASGSRYGGSLGRTRSARDDHDSSSIGTSGSSHPGRSLNVFIINCNSGGRRGSTAFETRALQIDAQLESLRRAQQQDPSNVALAMQIGSVMEEGAQCVQEHLASHGVRLGLMDCRALVRHQMGRSGGDNRQVRELFEALRDRRDGFPWR